MKIFINKVEVNKEQITVNDGLNYGRFFNENSGSFELQLTKNELINLIEKDYIKIKDEIKTDDKTYKDTSDFTNTNYCSLLDLLNQESDFEKIMKTYFDILLYKKLFLNSDKNTFVINSTDCVKIINNTVVLEGKVFTIS